jgi:hypothetical protein
VVLSLHEIDFSHPGLQGPHHPSRRGPRGSRGRRRRLHPLGAYGPGDVRARPGDPGAERPTLVSSPGNASAHRAGRGRLCTWALDSHRAGRAGASFPGRIEEDAGRRPLVARTQADLLAEDGSETSKESYAKLSADRQLACDHAAIALIKQIRRSTDSNEVESSAPRRERRGMISLRRVACG